MNLKSFALLFLALPRIASAQQLWLYDNTSYKAIYFKEACNLIASHPDLVLLDVRSPGEYADTSRFIASRIGRLKGAINVSIDSVKQHYNDLLAYKDKTILVYCSHSMRSRRVSKFLADSGFAHVYSLNGGMTEVNREPAASFPCKSSLYTSGIPYKLMGPEDALAFMADRNHVVLDVRPVPQFNGSDTIEANNIGRVKTAVNVPKDDLDRSMAALEKYKSRPILVYDLYTDNAMTAAAKLKAAGFTDVSVLFDGFDTFLLNFPSSGSVRKQLITAAPPYHIAGVREAIDLVNHTPGLIVADMRPKDHFSNTAKPAFFNLGRIKGATNFSTTEELEDYLKSKPKNTPVLVYGSTSASSRMLTGTVPAFDVALLCKRLAAEGYTNVYLLYDGIYSLVWASANVDGQQDAKTILTDHAGLY
ncbi:MAG TPA: rhodanese-like domain-containing protein [Puia sp.]|nr:rhodanese-like domain-containing protein [Puia sp.]